MIQGEDGRGWTWTVGGTGDGGNIIRAWTRRKKTRVERKGEKNVLLVLEGNFYLEQGWGNMSPMSPSGYARVKIFDCGSVDETKIKIISG